VFTYHVQPLIAAEATTFVLIQKVAKNQVIRNASLPHKAITRQIKQNLGCCLFTLLRSLLPLASVKSRYALPLRTSPPLFCPISSEAVLLTGKRNTSPPCHCERSAATSSHARMGKFISYPSTPHQSLSLPMAPLFYTPTN
jgi:hypothetical protein